MSYGFGNFVKIFLDVRERLGDTGGTVAMGLPPNPSPNSNYHET
jgi:hypothetical protein